ncbi:PTH2 [Candida jiufengensis]|uniref:PTH2 n=1 Tax=Candida jiufengensis TaxID=497108 RepID=UPI0022248F44|nr:PTH2 [Candida jiufengensis]KAI5956360.1 PTH2 [Candida jiufengensis]
MNSDSITSHNSTSYSTIDSSLNSNTDNTTTPSTYGSSSSSSSSLSSGEEDLDNKSKNRSHLRQLPQEQLPHLNLEKYANLNPSINANTLSHSLSHSSSSISPSPSPPKSNDLSNSHVITYIGRIYSILDALLLIEACRLKMIPIINRRLTILERSKFIKPNTIFIWNETSCGMKRWTDGKIWSASKVYNGNFLQYKELNKFTKKEENNGLIKQSFSLTTKTNQRYHLISYFKNSYQGDNLMNNNQSLDFSENLNLVNIPSHDTRLKNLKLSDKIYSDHSLHTLINSNLTTNLPLSEKPKLPQQSYHHQHVHQHNSIPLPPQQPHHHSQPHHNNNSLSNYNLPLHKYFNSNEFHSNNLKSENLNNTHKINENNLRANINQQINASYNNNSIHTNEENQNKHFNNHQFHFNPTHQQSQSDSQLNHESIYQENRNTTQNRGSSQSSLSSSSQSGYSSAPQIDQPPKHSKFPENHHQHHHHHHHHYHQLKDLDLGSEEDHDHHKRHHHNHMRQHSNSHFDSQVIDLLNKGWLK